MLRTYKALLRGNQLEWTGEAPDHLEADTTVPVHVTLLETPADHPPDRQRGARMADVLNKLATMQALPEMKDPAAWEREIRRDRPLPDRES